MANLKTFSGFPIQNLSSDPVPFAQAKTNDPYGGVWASGGNLNNARQQLTGTGIQTAALAIGGYDGSNRGYTENYNGSSWTEVADLNAARRNSGSSGTTTAALAFGGFTVPPASNGPSALNEQWDGSSWTETADLNTARFGMGSVGTTTASLASGGITTAQVAVNESWNGSAWTEVGDLNTARGLLGSMGTSTAGLVAGGGPAPAVSNAGVTESWNGSAWTEVADLNQGGDTLGSAGTQTSGLVFGGTIFPPGGLTAKTESWDGSSWTEVNDLAVDRQYGARAGASNSSALYAGGNSPGDSVATTEEWAFSGIPPTAPAEGYSDALVGQMYYNSTSGQFKAIKDGGQPVGTWASASGINTGRSYFAGAGTATDSMVFGGYATPGTPTGTTEDTEIWNGSSWTEVSNLNEAPYYNMAGSGASSTAALCYSGQGAGSRKNNAESWNGSSWTEITGINTARSGAAGVGPQTAAMCFGGNTYNPPPSVVYQALTEIWNGSSWTEVNDLNTARGDIAPVGSVYTDVLAVSGGSPNKTNNESFNGSTWTELADTNTTASSRSGSGVPAGPTAIVSGGYAPGVTANTEAWDGSSWTETGDLATARGKSAESASSTTGFQVGGETPSTPKNTNVEEFSFTDFQINTLTTS